MADFEQNLDSEQYCTGRNGGYIGRVYYLGGFNEIETAEFEPVQSRSEDLQDLPRYVARAQQRLAFRGEKMPAEKILGVSVLRSCNNREHLDEFVSPTPRPRIERVATIAIVGTPVIMEDIKPLSAHERRLSSHGVGRARRELPGTVDVPVIHLPTVSHETFFANTVIKTLAGSTLRLPANKVPYIVLHDPVRNQYVEQLLTRSDLE